MRAIVSWATLSLSFSLVFISAPLHADPGDLDATFAAGGVARFDFSQPIPIRISGTSPQVGGGSVVVGGLTSPQDGLDHVVIGRLNPDGTLDGNYGSAGWTSFAAPNGTLSCAAVGIASTSSGAAVAVASCGGYVTLFRADEWGQPDLSWGPDGIRVDTASAALTARAITIGGGGFIYVAGGSRASPAMAYDTFLKRYTPGGLADSSFGSAGLAIQSFGSGDDEALALAVAPDNRIVVAGYAQESGGPKTMLVTRFSTTGAVGPFGSGTFATRSYNGEGDVAHAVAFDAQGRIVVAGRAGNSFMGVPQALFFVWRLTGEGDPDSFGASGSVAIDMPVQASHDADSTATTLDTFQDGSILVGGVAVAGGASHFAFVCVNPIGNIDFACGSGGRFMGPVTPDNDVLMGTYITSDYHVLAIGAREAAAGERLLVVRFVGEGPIDAAFGDGGTATYTPFMPSLDQVNDVALQADGGILIAAVGPSGGSRVARLDASGNFDASFGSGGIVDLAHDFAQPRGAYALAVQPDGRILVASAVSLTQYSPPHEGFAVTRLLSNGTKDTSWSGNGDVGDTIVEADTSPTALALYADGKVLLLGKTEGNGGRMLLMRMNADGSKDFSLDPLYGWSLLLDRAGVAEDSPQALAIDADGSVLAAGYTKLLSGAVHMILYRLQGGWLGNTVVDFGTTSVANAIAIQPDRKVVLAGACGATAADSCFARLDQWGSLDPTFGTGGLAVRSLSAGADRAIAVRLTPNGKIVAGVGHEGGLGVALLNAAGSLDAAFHGTGFNLPAAAGVASAAVRQSDGRMVVAGTAASAGRSSWVIARFESDDETPPETTLDISPAGSPTPSTAATLTFAASEAGSTFECRLDGAPFAACTSPVALTGLSNGSHTFLARATDPAGNVDPTPASRTWVIDTIPPSVAITGGPTGTTNSPSATFTFASDNPGATFMCAIGGMSFAPCSSPKTVSPPGDGSWTFLVYAVGPSGLISQMPAHREWVLDTIPPYAAWVTGAPLPATNQTVATFTFEGSEPNVTFLCRLDAAPAAACSSPITYSGLAPGLHTFFVRAVDAAGNMSPETPPLWWMIDLTVPDTLITSGPSGMVSANSATFTFAASEPNARFDCRLDGAAFAQCASAAIYTGLAPGNHLFEVRASDLAGNVDATPAARAWQIAGVPDTTITSGPSLPGPSVEVATFTFTSTIAGSTFECRLDGAAFTACASPITYTLASAPNGQHLFLVRARWGADVDPSPAIRQFAINAVPPNTTITNKPPVNTGATSALFDFTSTKSPATFECVIDAGSFAPCTHPIIYTGLALGSHGFAVRALDAAGNVDPTPASYTWTIH